MLACEPQSFVQPDQRQPHLPVALVVLDAASLRRMYAHACASRAHVMVHRMMDVIEQEECPHKARVKMDALKWMAGKLNRADFGDEPTQPGVSVTINNDGGSALMEEIRQRLARKRQALSGKSMLSGTGGPVESRGAGEGEGATRPPALSSDA
jgi:hypothetical protein